LVSEVEVLKLEVGLKLYLEKVVLEVEVEVEL
jgi:hypothetical protein